MVFLFFIWKQREFILDTSPIRPVGLLDCLIYFHYWRDQYREKSKRKSEISTSKPQGPQDPILFRNSQPLELLFRFQG